MLHPGVPFFTAIPYLGAAAPSRTASRRVAPCRIARKSDEKCEKSEKRFHVTSRNFRVTLCDRVISCRRRRGRYSDRRLPYDAVILLLPPSSPIFSRYIHVFVFTGKRTRERCASDDRSSRQSPSSKIRNSISQTEFLLIHLLLTEGEMFHIGKLSPFLSNSVCGRGPPRVRRFTGVSDGIPTKTPLEVRKTERRRVSEGRKRDV